MNTMTKIRQDMKERETQELELQSQSLSSNTDAIIANNDLTELADTVLNSNITQYIPSALARQVLKLDTIVQTGIDTLVTVNLSVMASLSAGTVVYDEIDDSSGSVIIIYSAAFFKSGGGKTAGVSVNRTYFLDWKEKEISTIQEEDDKRKEQIQLEIKSLGQSAEDRVNRKELEEELLYLKTQPDVYLEDATAEGFKTSIECGSNPFLLIDNFGIYMASAKSNENKKEMIRMMDNVFDSGKTTTRRLKGDDKRAKQLSLGGFGATFASTIGDSNLKPKDIKDNIENGFFNKVLITFQATMEKSIPLKTSLNLLEKGEIEKFARAYHAMAGENDFYLSNEAYNEYKVFHENTSTEFMRRYNNDEDLAGLIIRLLKLSKRIACIFEIASQCETYIPTGVTLSDEVARPRLPISAKNMKLAIDMLEYLKDEHTSKILLYASSANGKISKKDLIFNAIQRLHDKGEDIDNRSIIHTFSKVRRMNVAEIKPHLNQLISERKIGVIDATHYKYIA